MSSCWLCALFAYRYGCWSNKRFETVNWNARHKGDILKTSYQQNNQLTRKRNTCENGMTKGAHEKQPQRARCVRVSNAWTDSEISSLWVMTCLNPSPTGASSLKKTLKKLFFMVPFAFIFANFVSLCGLFLSTFLGGFFLTKVFWLDWHAVILPHRLLRLCPAGCTNPEVH